MEKGKIYTMPTTVKTGMAVYQIKQTSEQKIPSERRKVISSNFITTKLFTSQKAIRIPSIYSPNNKALKYMK